MRYENEFENPLKDLIEQRDAEIQAVHNKYAPRFHQLISNLQHKRPQAPRISKYAGFPKLAQTGEDNG